MEPDPHCPSSALFPAGCHHAGTGVPRPSLRHPPCPSPFAAEPGPSGRKATGNGGAACAPRSPARAAPQKQSPDGAVSWGLLFEGDKETPRLLIPL